MIPSEIQYEGSTEDYFLYMIDQINDNINELETRKAEFENRLGTVGSS